MLKIPHLSISFCIVFCLCSKKNLIEAQINRFSTKSLDLKKDWSGIEVPAKAGKGKIWQLQDAVSDDFHYEFKATLHVAIMNGKWTNFFHNNWEGPAPTKWVRKNVSVSDGHLKLKATRKRGEKNHYSKIVMETGFLIQNRLLGWVVLHLLGEYCIQYL